MKILILGAGCIGIYLGTLLYSKGHNVSLLGRKKLKKVHETLLIEDTPYKLPKKNYSIPNKSNYDYIFITSKLYDLETNLRYIQKKNIKAKYLISIQNGIVEESFYKPYIKNYKFTTISVYEGYRLVENKLFVSQSNSGWKTDNSPAGKNVSNLLQEAGINCSSEENLESLKAEKTIMNCSVNALSAMEKKTFFELYANKKTKKIINDLFEESYSVLKRFIKIRPKKELKKNFYEHIKIMKHYSSTYQDAISKRKTEINFLNGFIIKLGKKYGIPTPKNEEIFSEFINKYPNSK